VQKAHHDLRVKTKATRSDGRRLQVQEKEQGGKETSMGHVEKNATKSVEENQQ
jgi:hypothetical protein